MWATEADLPEVKAFLNAHVVQSMFPLANLKTHGLNGDHPRAPSFWLTRQNGEITGVLTVTREGMLMPQCPTKKWQGVAETLKNRDVIGIIGPADQARSLQKALGLTTAPTMLDHDEPQYELALDDLVIPVGAGDIVPLADADRDEMIGWRTAYDIEALNTSEDEAGPIATENYESYIANQSHVTLMEGDTAFCTTGFNARLPDIVQIGGVYTPPDKRCQGHARRAVALHLNQAKQQGVTRATLFPLVKTRQRLIKRLVSPISDSGPSACLTESNA